jgi:predicted nucleic acid-binding Zn ribbon protein
MYCKKCGAQIEDNSVFCKECGERLIEKEKKPLPKKKIRKIIISVVAGILVIGIIVFGILFLTRQKEMEAEKENEILSPVSISELSGEKFFRLPPDLFREKFNRFSSGLKLEEGKSSLADSDDEDVFYNWIIDDDTIALHIKKNTDLVTNIMLLSDEDSFYQKNAPAILKAICPSIPEAEIKRCIKNADTTPVGEDYYFMYEDIKVLIFRADEAISLFFYPRER